MAKENLLKQLVQIPSVSGHESKIIEFIKSQLEGHVDQLTVDKLGNLIAIKGRGRKLALCAHVDQIGLLVKHIEDNGVIRFIKIGAIDDRILPGSRFIIHGKRPIPATIGIKPPHLAKKEELDKVLKYDELYLDIGASSAKQARALGVELGNQVTFDSKFEQINDLVIAPGLDNKAGVYVAIELLKRAQIDGQLIGIFSVQEEVGLKGARTAAYALEPDFTLVLDVTLAGGTPAVSAREAACELGKGPAINFIEASGRGAIVPEHIRTQMVELAKKAQIPYQVEILSGGMTDAAIIQLTKDGLLCGGLSIPVRNAHTPGEICSMADIENCIKLAEIILSQIKI